MRLNRCYSRPGGRYAAIMLAALIGLTASLAEEELYTPAPSSVRFEKSMTTIGQLVRRSDAIAHVSILNHLYSEEMVPVGVELRINRIIFGQPPNKVAPSWERVVLSPSIPPVGEEGILFMTHRVIGAEVFRFGTVTTVDDLEGQAPEQWYIVGGARAFIPGGRDDLYEVEAAIKEFIKWHRTKEMSRMAFANFLAELWDSENERLSEDARIDLMYFRTSLSVEEQDALMALDDFPEVLRTAILDWRERAQASIQLRSREEVEDKFTRVGWEGAMQSGDKWRIREAFRVLDSVNYYEQREYPDLWVPDLRNLLDHDDLDVRVWAASHLSFVQDMRAIPVLLEALRDPYWQRHGGPSLRRITGQDFPFDPTAPEDVREEQIRVWEDWWSGQSDED